MEYAHHYRSPLGWITMASEGKALSGLWFDGQKYFPDGLSVARCDFQLPVFAQTDCWLDCYFSGCEPDFTPPLSLKGTDFRRAVWEILLTIPYGHTVTYGQIAARISPDRGLAPMSARAVGGAVGHNPISLIVPCHRVVGTDGSLTGYAGGLDRKIRLLTLEKVTGKI